MSECDTFDFEEHQDEFPLMDGLRGKDGTTFYPHVSAEGVLSWTNDGGKQNPDPVNIKGADGKSAYAAAQEAGFTGTEAEFNEYLSGIGDLTQEVADQKSVIEDLETLVDRKAGALVDTVSGAIASFTPDATIDNLLGVSVAVEPVQDLHGYDNPWPTGGGKNKFGIPIVEIGKAWNGPITSARAIAKMNLSAGTYTISINGQNTIDGIFYKSYSESPDDVNRITSFPFTLTLTAEEPNLLLQFNKASISTADIEALMLQVESGPTATAYAPYSNICPISGWDAVGIAADGANIAKIANQGLYWQLTDSGIKNMERASGRLLTAVDVKAGVTYTANLRLISKPTASTSFTASFDDVSSYVPFNFSNFNSFDVGTTYSRTLSFDADTTLSYTMWGNGNSDIFEFQFWITTDGTSTYSPYQGNIYTIQLGQTVYGGTLTIAEDGSVTALVDRAGVDLGTETWARQAVGNTYRFLLSSFHTLPGAKTTGGYDSTTICSNYPSNSSPIGSNNVDDCYCVYNGVVLVRDDSYDTVEAFSAAMSGVLLVYPLATPVTIQLDPVTISTIAHQTNNVWADAGDVTVEYAADLKAYIDRLNQPTEDDMIANSLIASGKYFTVNNRLFLSTASIAVGAQIIPGTNCTETSLVEALNALNA